MGSALGVHFAWVALVALASETTAGSGFIPQFAGPFITYIDHMRPCGGALEKANWFHVRVSHFKPTKPLDPQVWNGFVNVTDRFDDTWWVRMVMDSSSNNEWKENAFVFNFLRDGCSKLREQLPHGLQTHLSFPPKGEPCVLKKGVVPFVNKSVHLEYRHFPVMPYGFYRARMTGGLHGVDRPRMCSHVTVHIIPRPASP